VLHAPTHNALTQYLTTAPYLKPFLSANTILLKEKKYEFNLIVGLRDEWDTDRKRGRNMVGSILVVLGADWG
jgi:hypothetical protein